MQRVKQTLEKALLEAGKELSGAIHLPKQIRYKGRANLVTQTDKSAEKKILRIISRQFPDHFILSEEANPHETHQNRSPYRWIVDPLDGTTNFAHGFPTASVSIAFEDHGVIKTGGVFNPFTKELFLAEKGKGAYLNRKRIRVSAVSSLAQSLLVTGFPYDRSKHARFYLKMLETFLSNSHGIRRLGSAALDYCFVACGRFDGFWELKLNPWDQAAGCLIVREAGGRVTNLKGGPFDLYGNETLATNGKIHREMVTILSKFV